MKTLIAPWLCLLLCACDDTSDEITEVLDTSHIPEISDAALDPPENSCNLNGILDEGEECDGEQFGGKTCASLNAAKPFGRLGCTQQCKISTFFCSFADLGLQAPVPDSESTDAQCSNGLNDFHTVNKDGSESNWLDCRNNQCNHSPLVQVCHATENSDAACSDGVDNITGNGLHNNFKNRFNGLVDCEDPSCFKNWRVTVCEDQAPRWELGEECNDGIDNDQDGVSDCDDPDCLHAGMSSCPLNGRVRVLFDNAHHQMAGAVDWIIDVTGRHPYPSLPQNENEWHGSLSAFAKDLIDSGHYIVETLPQDRKLTWQDASSLQDLSDYQILVLPEPSSSFTHEEASAVYEFVKQGGAVLMVADHGGADRDGNAVDAVIALNGLFAEISPTGHKEDNPFGFYVLEGRFTQNSTTKVAGGAENHPVISGANGNIVSTGLYGAAEFKITDEAKVQPLLTEKSSTTPFALAASVELGRVVALADSAIIGDGTNFLGLTLTNENGYIDAQLQNRAFLLNAMDWLCGNEL